MNLTEVADWVTVGGGLTTLGAAIIFVSNWLTSSSLKRSFAEFSRESKLIINGLEKRMEIRFDAVNIRFDALNKRIDGLDKRMDGIDKRIDGIDKRIDSLENRFNTIDLKLDNALYRNFQDWSQRRAVGSDAG